MADRAHTRRVEKCFCGRELRTAQERTYGECHRCQQENDDEEPTAYQRYTGDFDGHKERE